MFQHDYIIQFSSVFVVFLLWFISSFALRFFQFNASKPTENTNTTEAEAANVSATQHARFRAAIAAERTLLDGFLLLSVGVIFNCFGQGNRTAGDIFSLIIMFSLFFMTVFHYTGHSSITFALWILISLALLGLYIVPFATNSLYLGYYNVATPIIATTVI
ncbi:hypothetical protein K502DRAFT_364574 [Neoconidiobolus thromboides FSU 785]|nr:hypothetical protein K502DRAFT_364574 [Neoconidiobolus thromboides FSU 785]